MFKKKKNFLKGRLCVFIPLLFVLSLSAEDFISNGDFEDGVTDWSFTSWGTVDHDLLDDVGRSGDCVYISSPSVAHDCFWNQDVDLVPGDTYVLSGYLKPTSVSGGYGVSIGYTGASETTDTYTTGVSGTSSSWQYVDVEFEAEEGGEIRLRLGHYGQESTGTVLFDDIVLEDKYGNKLLVIVASSIHDEDGIVTALEDYHDDVLSDGWWTKKIRVNNDYDALADYDELDAEDLKEIIHDDFYVKGYDGILFIGSPPDIPVARWHEHLSVPAGAYNPTGVVDLFFADMDDWVDSDSDGVYESKDINENWLKSAASHNPELIYGRISAYNVKPVYDEGYYEDEADLITSYFARIATYRSNGNSSPLSDAQKNRGVFFRDDEWNGKSSWGASTCDIENMQEAARNITVYLDNEVTSKANHMDIIKEGNRFLDLGHHSGGFVDWDNNEPHGVGYTIEELNALTGTDRPYAEFLTLFACDEGAYADSSGNPQNYWGGAYLYNSGYMLNVTASSIGGVAFGDPTFFSELNAEKPIGEALQAMLCYAQLYQNNPCGPLMLLGDPLLVYPARVSTNKGPKICNQLRELVADVNEQFVLVFDIEDDNDDEEDIDLSLSGYPGSAVVNGKTLTWTPSLSDAGTNTVITATAEDTSGYTYTESFTVFVRAISVSYKCNETSSTTNTLRPWFKIKNEGNTTINLTDVKVRYWFTIDSEDDLDSACDYAVVGNTNITRNFVAVDPVKYKADYYLEIGFTAGAGTLTGGSDTGEIQLRIWKDDYSNFDQTDDHSFDPDLTSFGENIYVTGYYDSDINFGDEPEDN